MNKKIFFGSIRLILSFVLLIGCGKKGLIGEWTYFDGTSKRGDIYYTFKDEKNDSYTFGAESRNFTYTDDGKKLKILYDGDTNSYSYEYKLENDTFTIKDSFGSDVVYKRK